MKKFLWVTGLLMLFPFIAFVFYAVPASDDFHPYQIVQVFGAENYAGYMYKFWSGRYLGNMLAQLNPTTYGRNDLYWIPLLSGIVLLWVAFIHFYRSLNPAGFSKKNHLLAGLFFLLLLIYIVPSIGSLLFWGTGITYYTLPLIFSVFIFSVFIRCRNKNSIPYLLFWSISIFCISLINELHGVSLSLLMLIYLIFLTKPSVKSAIQITASILVALLAGLLILALAPGNQNRIAEYPNAMNIGFGVYSAMKSVFFLSVFLLTKPGIIVILLLSLAHTQKIRASHFSQKALPKLTLLLLPSSLFIIPFAVFFMVCFMQGTMPPLRVFNLATPYLLLGFIMLSVCVGLLLTNSISIELSPVWKRILVVTLCFFMIVDFGFDFDLKKPSFRSNISNAGYELFMEAPAFQRNQNLREEEIKTAKTMGVKTVFLTPIRRIPKTLYAFELTDNPEHWSNRVYADYYGLDSVIVVSR